MNSKVCLWLSFGLSILASGSLLPIMTQAEESSAGPTVKVRLIDSTGTLTEPVPVPKVQKTDAEWRKQLTAEQYAIARGEGTEPAFCGTLLDNHRQGIYHCLCCGLPLFASDSKFDSGTGWPSFFQPVAKENVVSKVDDSFGMHRTEILCARCGAHLGHVFADGPPPTGLRFCLNSAAMTFVDKGKEIPEIRPGTAK
jgi:methionine-R-sulfoxide reductase